ncbi:MAG: DoxX family protein [Hyphomonas sp.]|nr:DoxX family protein [Hyphomonas sp.]MCA8904477.1 DoxX family protein [Hyphomonas sp.]MCB9962747.1 DoxX family protein [Hyphomonas sp.]MCB9969953.1 DoxX family protein [Hyphomonas sp.]
MFVQDTFYPLPDPPDGWVKFFDAPGQNVVFQTIAERSGVTLFEPAGRFFVGVVEILAAIFLLFPRSRRFGAFLSALVTGAAIGFHLSPWLGRDIPLSLNPANTQTDGGMLFMLAIIMFAASLLLMVAHPGRIRA